MHTTLVQLFVIRDWLRRAFRKHFKMFILLSSLFVFRKPEDQPMLLFLAEAAFVEFQSVELSRPRKYGNPICFPKLFFDHLMAF